MLVLFYTIFVFFFYQLFANFLRFTSFLPIFLVDWGGWQPPQPYVPAFTLAYQTFWVMLNSAKLFRPKYSANLRLKTEAKY